MEYKWHSEFNENEFRTYSPGSEECMVILWESVEAIFLSNQTPRDGDYHNFKYTFILNKEPKIVKNENQSWFNRIIGKILPKVKISGLPTYETDDHIQKDFKSIAPAIEKYLGITNTNQKSFLSMKFGNKVEDLKKTNNQYYTEGKSLKYFGFYKIFDRNTKLEDALLNRFREETKK